MGRKFWYTIIKSIDKKKVVQKWEEIISKEMVNSIKDYINKRLKEQKDIDDSKFTVTSDKKCKTPLEKAEQYPKYYLKKGVDGKYYVRTKSGNWEKVTTKSFEDVLHYSGIGYMLGYEDKKTNSRYEYCELPKNIKNTQDVVNYICENQCKMDKGVGMAIEYKNKTIIGGWVDYDP